MKKQMPKSIIIACSLIFTASLQAKASKTAKGRGNSPLSSAISFYNKKNFKAAANSAFQVLQSSPTNPDAGLVLAQSLEKMDMPILAGYYLIDVLAHLKSYNNNTATQAFETLANIQENTPMHISAYKKAFASKVDKSLPPKAANFYNYIKGHLEFLDLQFNSSAALLGNVRERGENFAKAQFILGVISNLRGKHEAAINHFEQVVLALENSSDEANLKVQANINIARVYYETKDFSKSISYYAKIPRLSPAWPQVLFESAWAFYLMEKPNNTLGNLKTIHSPFFKRRFFPESYILEAISYLKLCVYNNVKDSIEKYNETYNPLQLSLKKLLQETKGNRVGFFNIVYSYSKGTLKTYKPIWVIIDTLSYNDQFSDVASVVRQLAKETNLAEKKLGSNLAGTLESLAANKKSALINDAGGKLYEATKGYYEYLVELSNQTKLLKAELMLGKVDELRAKLKVTTADKKDQFIGGLAPLKVGERLEYWPFEQEEYWKDELGGYVFNIASQCQ